MPRAEIQKTLQSIRLELERMTIDQEDGRARIEESVRQLEEQLLDESRMTGDEYLLHELKESIEEFEESHPVLTDLVSRLSDLFAKIGI